MTAWLRAMTYNVRYDNAEDGEHRWANRREAVASTIRFHAPDVVGLQEPLDHQLVDVADALPGFEWIGCGRVDGESEGEHTPIGYRTDRFECVDSDTFWLSETPDEPGSVGWDARHPRIVTWARLRDQRTGDSLLFANTHFSHDGPRARQKSARLLLDRLADLREDDPVVLTGDFNCVAGEEPYEILTGEDSPLALSDERDRSSEPAHGPPTSVTDFENLVPNRKIDHVFTTPDVSVGAHGVCSDVYDDGRFPSDHLPVLVELGPGEG
ncbi:Endonuclease-exonuclease-phosphatase protein [Halorhabdus tiamatea SARL4B]|uniref:Endonuclease-exonuclease-phosphatase protein n=1 Tax=Halorhabdus tiamatea SARL4B TaxID=1033806 RepID=F7PNA1_9EURY|nr:endonuclease/exonuclease/phosphatase family protein [Halorhabdus tiamatea]ERJ07804.1 Endonuclease-exonuclease-phosphatase protein [Halorhabdus tiamatea SARL4B]CCQ33394.1 endonuclease/exonuclease/phosphatase [Halorhabdus tiamatea SARL4B]